MAWFEQNLSSLSFELNVIIKRSVRRNRSIPEREREIPSPYTMVEYRHSYGFWEQNRRSGPSGWVLDPTRQRSKQLCFWFPFVYFSLLFLFTPLSLKKASCDRVALTSLPSPNVDGIFTEFHRDTLCFVVVVFLFCFVLFFGVFFGGVVCLFLCLIFFFCFCFFYRCRGFFNINRSERLTDRTLRTELYQEVWFAVFCAAECVTDA